MILHIRHVWFMVRFYGPKFLGPRKLKVITYYSYHMSSDILLFSHTKWQFFMLFIFFGHWKCHF